MKKLVKFNVEKFNASLPSEGAVKLDDFPYKVIETNDEYVDIFELSGSVICCPMQVFFKNASNIENVTEFHIAVVVQRHLRDALKIAGQLGYKNALIHMDTLDGIDRLVRLLIFDDFQPEIRRIERAVATFLISQL